LHFTDPTGYTIELKAPPQRIVSLVPSQTELLYDLGLQQEVAGITKFCVHPNEWFRSKPRVGGTKTVDIEKVKALQPDLVLANKEENVKEQIEALRSIAPVWTSDITTIAQAYDTMQAIGAMTGKSAEANKLVHQIQLAFQTLKPESESFSPPQSLSQSQSKSPSPPQTAYLIWRNPYMAAGGDTFINSMLEICGFENILKNENRYPEITIRQLSAANCQLLLLSSEPFPFKEKHIAELQLQLPDTKIILADGEMFSWYGSRMLKAAAYFERLRAGVW
jgi:ABC-type Fe3+-hydroxamate transport system substrate-binding protein